MARDNTPLVWVDMEMSGLVPERDRIIEVPQERMHLTHV
jgi:oligoribonuclease